MALGRSRRERRTVDYWPVSSMPCRRCCSPSCPAFGVRARPVPAQPGDHGEGCRPQSPERADQRTTQLLALEQSNSQDLEDSIANLQASLSQAESDRSRLQQLLDQGQGEDSQSQGEIGTLSGELDSQRQISQRALSQVELLNQQISALRKQIAALEQALDVSEARDRESNTKIADLGRRLNVALAQRCRS